MLITIPTAETWPEVFDDSEARADWGWKHDHDLPGMCDVMFSRLRAAQLANGAQDDLTAVRKP